MEARCACTGWAGCAYQGFLDTGQEKIIFGDANEKFCDRVVSRKCCPCTERKPREVGNITCARISQTINGSP